MYAQVYTRCPCKFLDWVCGSCEYKTLDSGTLGCKAGVKYFGQFWFDYKRLEKLKKKIIKRLNK